MLQRSLSLSQSFVTPTLLPSTNLNAEVDTISTHSFIETTSTTTSPTTPILIAVIVVMFIVITPGGITCIFIILIQQRRIKSLNTNGIAERRSSFPEMYEVKETNLNRE